jgi:DNA-directed RNA polymerase specialized sigma24 family protein
LGDDGSRCEQEVRGVADDGDFSSYLVARWPGLIRTLVLLGCTFAQAEAVATDALSRCHQSWDTDRDSDDIDVLVYRTVLARLAKLRRAGRLADVPEVPEPPLLLDPTAADPDQRAAMRRALEGALAEVPDDERVVLVLRFVAELSEVQVADVLDLGVAEVRERRTAGLSRVDLVDLREAR